MFESLTTSVDGILVLGYIIALVVFFLFGPHKVYEGFFGALIGLGCGLFIARITDSNISESFFGNGWLISHRGILLYSSNIATLCLLFFAPISVGINTGGLARGNIWFFFKLIILSGFFVLFTVAFLSLLAGKGSIMNEAPLLPSFWFDIPFFTTSKLYPLILEYRYTIIGGAFLLAIYKIVFSHWIDRGFLVLSTMVLAFQGLLRREQLDTIITHGDNHGGDHVEAAEEHPSGHDDHGHH